MITHHRGISLIEILVSLILISLMLLEFDAVQIISLREASVARYVMIATQQLDVMTARLMVSNGDDYSAYIRQWNIQNADLLPNGRGIVLGTYPDYVIEVSWGEGDVNPCEKNKIGKSGCLRVHAWL